MNACSSFDNIIGSLHLGESTLPSASLLPFAKCHKSFSNFLLSVDFFLSLLLLGFFKIDSDFHLSCNCYFYNNFHMNCYQGLLMYFIISCVFPCLIVIVIAILILFFFHTYSFSLNILSSINRYARYVKKLCKNGMYMKNIVTLS